MTNENMAVLINVIGAVETGGQVYGKRNYANYGKPYQNTPKEHTITLGYAANYGSQAELLVQMIFNADPEKFRAIDTAGIIEKRLKIDWEAERWNPTPEQRVTLIRLIDSEIGHICQDILFAKQLELYLADCTEEFTTDVKAQMMYCEIRHLGGKNSVDRIFRRCTRYDLDSIMASLVRDQKDKSSNNQVGDPLYWSRHVKARQFIDEYAITGEKEMPVKIGSARIDENGRAVGGRAGDQTGKEVSTQDWYLHSKGWVTIRAKDPAKREKIARAMERACANPHIGYDQSQNRTLWNVVKNLGYDPGLVTQNVETDCGQLVRVCVWYAGIKCDDFYTANEVEVLRRTGQFDILTSSKYTTSSKYLLRGDIQVTKTKGHTIVVLSNGSMASEVTVVVTGNDVIRSGQEASVLFTNHKIEIDGIRGPETRKQAVRVLQEAMNRDYKAGLVVDGEIGPKTKAALKGHYVRYGETQYMVTAAEILLALKGKNPNGIEYPGSFGKGLEKAAGDDYLDETWFIEMTR